jgi:hypothetical protein
LRNTVPETISKSACRGVARITSAPKRAWSKTGVSAVTAST